ncbi:hypothetical protein LZ31DRAFT_510938 [Colletotrichum somersetense]|nr:hypothetical protein LZ31DRAFT_510938 [Colletotrichum somersetense]
MRFFTALALAAPLVSAMKFTGPRVNSTVTKGSSYELTWNTVDTDPSTFSVLLVNFVNWPPSYTVLAENVDTFSGAVSVDVPCDTINSPGYQFNAINGTNVFVIYAQTPKFSISGADCTGPTPLPAASPSPCAPPSTVTVTVSKTLSKNSTTAATGGFSAAQSKITTSAAPSSQTTSAPVFHGTCPDIIGWASDYNHPVTLTKPPHHPDDAAFAFAQPTKAPHPIGGGDDDYDDDDGDYVTSTIYSTTYLPLEMAPTGSCNC